jgi:ABC-type transport system substrate-binding protein
MRKKLVPTILVVGVAALVAACGGSSSSSTSTSSGGGTGTAPAGSTSGSSSNDFLNNGFPAPVTPTKGGRLHVAFESNIDCWNGISYYGVSWSFFYFMARGLYGYPNTVKMPESDTIQPDLASALPTVSPDGLTYTVKLRPGLKFPDGSPVTAKDVKATYEYILDPNIQCATGGPPSSGYYDVIKGVAEYSKAMTDSKGAKNPGISGIKVVDPQTVEFDLTAKDGSFLRALAMGWSFIRPASTPHTNLQVPPPFVGPYKITSYVTDKSVTIDREPSWAANVAAGVPQDPNDNNIDGIDVEIGVPGDIQLQRLKSNSLDLAMDGGAPVGSDVPAVAADPQFKDRFFSTDDAAVTYGVFRMDRPPFDNVKLRQAVNYAIDRETWTKIAGGKLLREPWSQILSSNLVGDQPKDIYPNTADDTKAKQLIQESGVATPIPVELVFNTAPPGPEEAAAIKENLEAVGFKVSLKGLSSSVIYGYLQDNKAPWALGIAAWGQDYNDAITYFKPLLSCPGGTPTGSNYSRFCDPAFDAPMNSINALPPGPDRAAKFAQLSTDTTKNQVPWWTIVNRRQVNLVSTHVGNFSWGPGKQWYFGSYFVKQ